MQKSNANVLIQGIANVQKDVKVNSLFTKGIELKKYLVSGSKEFLRVQKAISENKERFGKSVIEGTIENDENFKEVLKKSAETLADDHLQPFFEIAQITKNEVMEKELKSAKPLLAAQFTSILNNFSELIGTKQATTKQANTKQATKKQAEKVADEVMATA